MNLFTGWRMRRKAAVVDTSEVAREYRAREAILVRDLAREWGTTEEVVRWSVTGGQEVIQQDFARAYGIPLSLTQRVLRGDAYATAGGPLAIPRKRRSRREAEA